MFQGQIINSLLIANSLDYKQVTRLHFLGELAHQHTIVIGPSRQALE